MTLIRPVKGLDDAMVAAFASTVACDPHKTLQVIIAMESADDPAYPLATAFRDAHPDRDIEVLVCGPAGPRMGKAHNMIAGAARAKNPYILFSDADCLMSRELLADAAGAFMAGADAVYGMPYHAQAANMGDWWFMLAFNHTFCVPAALAYRLGQFRTFAGAFMGYTRETLERVGGLEAFSCSIADDYALGLAARRAGARQVLLRVPVPVSETGTSTMDSFRHLSKWMSIICWSCPAGWAILPLCSATLLAQAGLAAAVVSGAGWGPPAAALAVALLSRVIVAWLQDRCLADYRVPLSAYARVLLADNSALLLWPLGLRRTIDWRSRRYRLYSGGRCRVVE